MIKKVTTTLLACLIGLSVFGQEKWDLEKCIQYAIENNLQLQLSELDVDLNEETLIQSRHQRYPNLNGFVSHNYNWGRSFDVFTNAPVTQRVQSNNFSLSTNSTLFNNFRIRNTIKQNEINVESSKLDLEQGVNDLILNIASSYLQILFNIENLRVAEITAESTREQLERTRKLVEGGVLPQNNLYDLQAQLATNELQIVNNENTLAISYLQLRQNMQLEEVDNFEIVTPELPTPEGSVVLEDPTVVYQTALTTQPNVKSADLTVQSAEVGIDIAEANFYPTISASANINTFYSSAQLEQLDRVEVGEVTRQIGFTADNTPVFTVVPDIENRVVNFGFFDQLEESYRRSVGLTLQIPIYNRHQAQNAVARSKIQQERARLNAKIVRNNLRQTIEQAYLDVVAASKTWSSNQQQVASLEEQFRVTQTRYNAGTANVTDFAVAQNTLNNAKSALLRAKYDFIFRQKILDFYMGKEIKL